MIVDISTERFVWIIKSTRNVTDVPLVVTYSILQIN